MTKEQKAAVERAVENYSFRVPYDGSNDFYDEAAAKHSEWGMQHVIDNPAEFGLETTKEALTGRNRILSLQLKNAALKSQLTKYREALEDIITEVHTTRHDWGDNMDNIEEIAKEALKQQ